MAYKQGKNPFSKNPLNFNSPLNSFDSLVGKLMNRGKSKRVATKIAGKVANMKMKGAGSGPTAAQRARMKQSPAKQAKPDFLDLDKDGNTTEPMKDAAKGSAAKMKSPIDKELVGNQKNLNEGLKKAIEAAPESPAKMKSPMKKHGDKFRKRAMKLSEKAEQGDYDYDNPKVVELLNKAKEADKAHSKEAPDAKSAPAKMKAPVKKLSAAEKRAKDLAKGDSKKEARMIEAAKKQAAAIKARKSPAKSIRIENPNQVAESLEKSAMGKRTAKSRGKVDDSGREGSNRQERKKRRQERRNIRKDKTLSASQKRMAIKESRQQQKDNVRGVKKDSPASMKAPVKPGGKRNPYTNSPMGDLSGKKVYGPATAAISAGKKIVKKGKKIAKKAVKAAKEFSKDLQKRGT